MPRGLPTHPYPLRDLVFLDEQAIPVKPRRGLDHPAAQHELRRGECGGEEEHGAPARWGRELEAHDLGDHDTDDDGELGEDAWRTVV